MTQRHLTLTPTRRWLNRVGAVARVASSLLCFGALGLIWALPAMRRRARLKAARCITCRQHQRWSSLLVAAFLLLQAVGAATSAHTAVRPPPPCHTQVLSNGRTQPVQPQGVSPARAWNITRDVVTAPTSGLALLGAKAAGMHQCAGQPHTVMFWQPPRTTDGGSTVGDTFLAWKPSGQHNPGRLANTYGFTAAGPHRRYGEDISAARTDDTRLVRHESRHTDQWAVFTLAGGPLAFPVAYYADSALFPAARNHFERAAGLADGGYRAPPGKGPAPIWTAVAAMGAVLLLLLRTRIRWLSRALVSGWTRALAHHQPGRCPLHTVGWLRAGLSSASGLERIPDIRVGR